MTTSKKKKASQETIDMITGQSGVVTEEQPVVVEKPVAVEEEKTPEPEKPPEPAEVPPPVQPASSQAAVPMTIPLNPDGTVNARNNSEVLRYCGALVLGKGVPDRFDTPQKLFAALMHVRELKLPDTAIRQVANIHGVTSIFGDLPLALVQRSGKMNHFKEEWFDSEYNIISFRNKNLDKDPWGCVVWMAREGGELQDFSFTLNDATRAGLYPEKNAGKPWAKYTPMMLRYRARAIGLKSVFADILNGVSIAEYDFHTSPDMEVLRDVGPKAVDGKIADLQEALKKNAGGDDGKTPD